MCKKITALIFALTMLLGCFLSCDEEKTTEASLTVTYMYNTSEANQKISKYLCDTLGNLGITVSEDEREWDDILASLKGGDYTLARDGLSSDYSDPICFLEAWTTDSENNIAQFGKGKHGELAMYDLDLTDVDGYDIKIEGGTWEETYDLLIDDIKACRDKNARYALMHKAEDLLMSTGCIVPIYYYTDVYLVDDSVEGIYSSPAGYKYFTEGRRKGDNTVSVSLSTEPKTVDPAGVLTTDEGTLCVNIFSGLAKWSQDENGNPIVVADGAEKLSEGEFNNASGKVTYTYKLREGLRWSDGEPVKATDFEYAWNRAANGEQNADKFEVIDGYGSGKLNVVADDEDNTITVTLGEAVPYWNEIIASPCYYPVRKDETPEEYLTEGTKAAICNGPFIISESEDGTVTLKKNGSYINADSVTIEEIKLRFSESAENNLSDFNNGTLQLVEDISTYDISAVKEKYSDELVVKGRMAVYYLCFNINSSLLPDTSNYTSVEKEKAQQNIRKAISLLIDRNHIVDDITCGGEVPASSFVAMGITDADGNEFYMNAAGNAGHSFVGYYDISEEAYESNCREAAEILSRYYKISQ